MRYWIGLVCLGVAGWLVRSALAHRAKVGAMRAEGAAGSTTLHPSLALMADIMPGLVTGLLVFAGVKASLVYLLMDGGRFLSIVDLAGFLALLGGYGFWLRERARHPAAARPAVVAQPMTLVESVDGELPWGLIELLLVFAIVLLFAIRELRSVRPTSPPEKPSAGPRCEDAGDTGLK